ncbi:MAG: Do family serine endopeptidase [Betaproteobacteria bacterium]|nr:Do family serine endopeptidase [Betaproteobacteria bacterium]
MPPCKRPFLFRTVIALLACIAALPAAGAQPFPVDARGLPTLAPLISQVTPAVVNISVLSRAAQDNNPLLRDPFFRRFFNIPERPNREVAAGSGVIIEAQQGIVLTNYHVIKDALQVRVTLKDRRQIPATLVGADPATDIAVLKIDAPNLTALKLGDSDQLSVGDFVVAIGNPFGIGQTVTSGIVSALGRTGLNVEGYEDFIQTDASINPGNSGGALINLRGELIGINTAIIGPSGGNVGIGFAVPVNIARAVVNQITRFGEVRRGRFGVDIEDLTPDSAAKLNTPTTEGAIISNVQADSPAEKAGLRRGDVVLGFNGRPVKSGPDFRNRLALTPIDEEIELSVWRDGRQQSMRGRIAAPAPNTIIEGQAVAQLAGLKIANLERGSPQFGRIEGVLVVAVENGSAAASFGLRGGDVIAAINRQRVRNINEFVAALRGAERGFTMTVVRGDFVLTFTLR